MSENPELAIKIKVPEGAREVLIRTPHLVSRVCPEDVTVDFRDSSYGVWTPSDFFPQSVAMEVQ